MGTQGETSMDTRFDGLFATVAEQAGGIEPLFDYFFGFLCRKTDFFTVGRAACKEMLDKSFQKWTEKATEKAERERLEREKKQLHQRRQEEQQKQEQQRKQPVDLENRPKIEELTEDEEALYSQPADKGAEKSTQRNSSPAKTDQNAQQEEPAGSDDEQSTRRPEGNGGTTDKYRWTQTLESVDVYVPIGTGVRAAQCSVKITGSRLTVGLKGQPPILDGEFSQKVHADDCMWTLEDQNTVHLSLEKVDRMRWWSCVLKGDPEIDTKTIVPENSKLSDLDPETRATVEKMMYDQQQKQRGLPTSDQQRQAEMLEKFKQSHPELDFSNAKINWGNSGWGG
ncbi:nuclear movement domain-containing protein, putative [Eimeria necatrix]|uniref:Nuclear migration protein nudC n=1 Tax=Eimeria necatrix TaxID=51315 RepID=U6MVI1_9EIME|nr:nuclear movement domain-containing protein, putative [Eimeria necatrix]CDJ68242.1 nuclear movement domain-containing protein, putative [Eimeria necatrix]